MIAYPNFYRRETSDDGEVQIIRITYATKREEILPLSYGDYEVADAVVAVLNLHRAAESGGTKNQNTPSE